MVMTSRENLSSLSMGRRHRSHNKQLTPTEPRQEKTCNMPYANNQDADQPVHPRKPAHLRSQISAFVVHCLDGIIPTLAKSKVFMTLTSFHS